MDLDPIQGDIILNDKPAVTAFKRTADATERTVEAIKAFQQAAPHEAERRVISSTS